MKDEQKLSFKWCVIQENEESNQKVHSILLSICQLSKFVILHHPAIRKICVLKKVYGGALSTLLVIKTRPIYTASDVVQRWVWKGEDEKMGSIMLQNFKMNTIIILRMTNNNRRKRSWPFWQTFTYLLLIYAKDIVTKTFKILYKLFYYLELKY